MRILLLGRRSEDQEAASEILRAAGHEVISCFPAADAWACTALDSPCPLDRYADVAVAVRQPGPEPYDGHGTVCARRRRVPLVAIGATRSDPVRAVADAIVPVVGPALLETCIQLSAGPSPAHTAAARRALADLVAPTEHLDVAVTRSADGLDVELSTNIDDPTHLHLLIERARAGVSHFDPRAARIAVSLHPLQPNEPPLGVVTSPAAT